MLRTQRMVAALAWLVTAWSLGPANTRAQQAAADQSTPGVVDVAEQDETAKAHFTVGKSLYDAGRFQEAAAEWEKAFEVSGKTELLYNIYVAYRDATDLQNAVAALERYLESDVDPQLRINLQARLDAMRASIASQQANQPAPEPAPVAEPVAPEPAPPPPEPAPAEEGSIAPYVVMAVGGAMIVAGVVTAVLAGSKVNDIEDACPGDVCPPAYDLEGERDSAEVLVTTTDVLLIGGLLASGVGAVLALVEAKDSTHPPPTTAGSPAIGCGPTGCAVHVSGRF